MSISAAATKYQQGLEEVCVTLADEYGHYDECYASIHPQAADIVRKNNTTTPVKGSIDKDKNKVRSVDPTHHHPH